MKNKFFLDNHEQRIRTLEQLCTKNSSSYYKIKTSKRKGIYGLKWYLLFISILLNIYLIIRI